MLASALGNTATVVVHFNNESYNNKLSFFI